MELLVTKSGSPNGQLTVELTDIAGRMFIVCASPDAAMLLFYKEISRHHARISGYEQTVKTRKCA